MTKFLDDDGSVKSWEVKYCRACGYAVDLHPITENWEFCPLCKLKGKNSKLSDALNIYKPIPEFRYSKPQEIK